MLAALTTDALVLIDPPTLKKAPTSIPTTCSFSSQPTACAWAPDHSCLFVSLGNTIEKYDLNGTLLDTIYSGPSPLTTLVSKDKGNTLILGAGTQVIVLETQTGKVPQSFKSHKLPVLALSLSNDSSLLASISVSTVHVHNLSLASHTVLRGLPSGEVTACAFHPHTRTRLLLGIGLQLAVYDTTRPSGPSKTIVIEKGAGQIVAIACSPFSKTLVAVAYSGGNVSLVDLEKDKGLFRTLSLHVPLTSLVFSPEGAALYAGTENGNVLTLDLRALDKPPKTISVSEDCQKVVYMAIQVRFQGLRARSL
ncbi:hypothetical protein PHLCEN_2v9135 [Hermanssonia centrifuga]|uniref:Pre-rRNA-processing protein IPI3 n=1 Tax=Hermanssonia centrifuga TaxID=98765 RepID=A0A2R6NRK2_9APHY|nr:hypothetical protein PHLCEN_2v9135 [Hermanssonia centrifuga]